MNKLLLDLELVKVQQACKGVIARYVDTYYLDGRGNICHTEKFKILKRQSCSGCQCCDNVYETFTQDISNGFTPEPRDCCLKHNDLVRLEIEELSHDWETGICDEWVVVAKLIA